MVQRRVSAAGLENASGYSAHSLRAGFVTEAKNRGIDEADIMRQHPAQERPDHAPLRPNLRAVDPQCHHRTGRRPILLCPLVCPIEAQVAPGGPLTYLQFLEAPTRDSPTLGCPRTLVVALSGPRSHQKTSQISAEASQLLRWRGGPVWCHANSAATPGNDGPVAGCGDIESKSTTGRRHDLRAAAGLAAPSWALAHHG